MSAENLRVQIRVIRKNMTESLKYNYIGDITDKFFADMNLLQQRYGEFIGKAKGTHQEYLKEISRIDVDITTCFAKLTQLSHYGTIIQIVNLAIGKISELLSFVETIESTPPEDKVPKASYDTVLSEKIVLENTVKLLAQYRGLPELNTLIEHSNTIGLPLDEHWVLALCSSNLIEAVVNKKLETLEEKAEGSFRKRYNKLCKLIKEKENREIQQLLPIALYEGVRNKLDHASNSNRVTPKEAKDISNLVLAFMKEIFQ